MSNIENIAVPAVVSPEFREPDAPTADTSAASTTPAALTVAWGGEEILVVDPRPMPKGVRDVATTRRAVVTAVLANESVNVPEEGAYALTSVTSPGNWEYVRNLARHDMLTPRRPAAMHLTTAEVEGLVPAFIIGMQPRTETEPTPVRAPRVRGELDADGRPIASLEMEFDDLVHFQDYTRQVVKSTDEAGGHYQVSIIEKGVSEPITAVPVKVVLLDGGNGEPARFTAYAVVDGITRLVRCYQVHLGSNVRIDAVANHIVDAIATPVRGEKPLHDRMLAARNSAVDEWRNAQAVGQITGAGKAAKDRGIRTGQAMTVRARVVLGCKPSPTTVLDAEDQFLDAAAELVRYTQENKAWGHEASAANAMHSAVRVLKGKGEVTNAEQADYLLGQTPVAALPDVTARLLGSGMTFSVHLAALFRAIYILRFLTRRNAFEITKQDLRTSLKLSQVRTTVYAATLAPLLEAPWRQGKASSLTQARNAYKRRGALTIDVEGAWMIVDAEPMDLYRRAVAGDNNARMTLTVGGGVALIADRFLTTEVTAGTGSGGSYVAIWKPTSIDEVVRLLGHPSNHRGLLQLALAMQAFDINKEAANGLRATERGRRTPQEASRFYLVPAAADDLVATRTDGIQTEQDSPIELTTELLLVIADYDGTRVADYNRNRQGTAPLPVTLQDLVDQFATAVKTAADLANKAVDKSTTDTSRVVMDEPLQRELARAQRTIMNHLDWIEDRADTTVTPYGEVDDVDLESTDNYYEAAEAEAYSDLQDAQHGTNQDPS